MPTPPDAGPLRFGVPPSVGLVEGDPRLATLRDLLRDAIRGEVQVSLVPTYQELGRKMRFGGLDFCWAPPFVCARLEVLGFRVLLRGVRKGASTYRSALVATAPGAGLAWIRGKRAAWVDQDSVSGYLLPLAFLKSQGIEPGRDLASQVFAGSFVHAVERVVAGEADFSAVFAPPAGIHWKGETGLAEFAPRLADKVKVIALTPEVPNSGLVVAPSARPEWVASVRAAFERLPAQAGRAPLLESLFQCDSVEAAPKMGYSALYRLATASL